MKILKNISILCLLFLALNVFTACSNKKSTIDNTDSNSMPNFTSEEEFKDIEKEGLTQDTNGTSNNESKNYVSSNRKLIRRIQMSAETLLFDKAMEAIMDEVNILGGYSESSDIYERGYYNTESRYASLTLRIPSDKVEQLLNLVGETTNILNKKETTEDVTLSYVDTEARVKSLEIQQERLLDLLKNADSLENIIILEQRLSEVRYELEEYGSRLRNYDNLVDYATVTLEIREVNKITPVETKGILNRMGTGILKSLGNVYNGFTNFIVWLVVNIPYIIIWSAIIFVSIKVIKKIGRMRMDTMSKNTELPEETNAKNDDKK